MILKETIRKILKEETQGIQPFLHEIESTFPETIPFIDKIQTFIEKSNCKKINISSFRFPAFGLALHDGVVFNSKIFSYPLSSFLFVIFHEIAHQYQYKKYGDDKMYECYLGEVDIKEAAETMKQIEIVADELAARKIREFVKLGLINGEDNQLIKAIYKNVPVEHFEKLISTTRNELRKKNQTNFEDITNYFYNMLKIKIK